MTTAIESQYQFTAEIQSKGKQQNRDGWTMTVDWKLPGSRFDLALYGQDWEIVQDHEVGETVTITISQGNLKTNKDGKYSSDYFWDMLSIKALGPDEAPPVQAPPKPDPTPRPPQPIPDDPVASDELVALTPTRKAMGEPPPNPAALGACHNHAVDFITSGILPVPEHRELVGWVRELRDKFYRDINQAPLAPLHYCYEHNEERREGRVSKGSWGHLLPKEADDHEDSYCIEGRDGWRVFDAGQ